MQQTARELGIGIGHAAKPASGVKPAMASYSPYMQAVYASHDGHPACGCPFGCADDPDLHDEFGRCHHVVGYSPDGKVIEPLVRRADGKLVVQVPREKRNGKLRPKLERVDPTKHHLVRITTSYIVYEDRDPPADWVVDGDMEPDSDDDTDDEEQ